MMKSLTTCMKSIQYIIYLGFTVVCILLNAAMVSWRRPGIQIVPLALCWLPLLTSAALGLGLSLCTSNSFEYTG